MGYEDLKKQLREQRLGKIDKVNVSTDDIGSDDYNIDENWQKIKRLVDRIEPRLYKFLFKETRDASIDARNDLNELRKLCIEIRANILAQRQDNESNY